MSNNLLVSLNNFMVLSLIVIGMNKLGLFVSFYWCHILMQNPTHKGVMSLRMTNSVEQSNISLGDLGMVELCSQELVFDVSPILIISSNGTIKQLKLLLEGFIALLGVKCSNKLLWCHCWINIFNGNTALVLQLSEMIIIVQHKVTGWVWRSKMITPPNRPIIPIGIFNFAFMYVIVGHSITKYSPSPINIW